VALTPSARGCICSQHGPSSRPPRLGSTWPRAVSRMSPRLRRNPVVSRGALLKSELLLTCRAFERIDELACVAALLAILPLENSSPVHPANETPGIPC
jgi:hypothetical protein